MLRDITTYQWYGLDLKYSVPLSLYIYLYTIMLASCLVNMITLSVFSFFYCWDRDSSLLTLGREYIWEQYVKAVCDYGENGLQRLLHHTWRALQYTSFSIQVDYTFWSLESFHSFERSLKFKETEVIESGEEEVE